MPVPVQSVAGKLRALREQIVMDVVVKPPPSARHPRLGLLGWLALRFAPSITGLFVSANGWCAGLHKPSRNPPAWVF